MNATAPRFVAEPRVIKAIPAAPQPVALRARWSQGWRWLPDGGSRSRWSLLALVGVGLAIAGVSGMSLGGRPSVVAPVGNPQVAANGVVEGASRERPLTPEVAGTLKRMYVQVNQEVAAGALLFELQNDSQQAQVALAEAELAAAQAQLQHAGAEYQRHQGLVQQNAVSKADYENQLYRRITQQAHVREAEARLRLAQAELAKTQVRAPVAGRILQIYKEAGVLVGPAGRGGAGEPVLRLADMSRRRVRAFVEELNAGRVQAGQTAVVTADGFPGREYTGRVVEVADRMGKDAPENDAPGEYKHVYYREVVIELEGARELPLMLPVQVKIADAAAGND
ncbi:MAG: efflux RND transporter periplasmic adaptor subunit [Planctomycetia bacterium]|nr:efflux RND transporter periplasmic adaptor subunit [Planctomycetia bacterium]